MARAKRIEGVLAPVITPFRKDYAPDAERFVRHCRWLLKNGCSGLAVFGTNSEANSMSVAEKRRLLEALIAGGISPAALMPGTGHCALTDSVELTRAALEMGCAGVLMLPPFYYKNVSDEGLYRNFAEVIERVGDERLQLYLYHIPPVSQVPISLGLIERLLASTRHRRRREGFLGRLVEHQGDARQLRERRLRRVRRQRGVPARQHAPRRQGLHHRHGKHQPRADRQSLPQLALADADRLQAAITATRKIVQKQPMIAALKATVAHFGNDPQWKTLRPPLVELNSIQEQDLISELKASGFSMPGLG